MARSKAAGKSPSEARRGKRALLVGTIKGGFLLSAEGGRRRWSIEGPFLLGSKVHDVQLDPRDGRTLLLTSTGGHLGPTIYRSTNRGRKWTEVEAPPKFRRSPSKRKTATTRGRAVNHTFWLTPSVAEEPGVWYAGTSPPGLFRSDDGGLRWKNVLGFNENRMWRRWTTDGDSGTPDGSVLHSICVDPRDRRHLYINASSGGTFESLDRGKSWAPLNAGVSMDFFPGEPPAYGHDPHCMLIHPADPDVLYQQNHCGIYRLDRTRGDVWDRIGKRLPKKIGDIGFPVVAHPTDPDTVWVFPMDGTTLWPRTSPGGQPAVYRTRDAGRSWQRLDRGLPREHGWLTVKRQAMTCDGEVRNPGVYFGTTGGQVWGSANGGESWSCLAAHLPHVYSLRAVRFA